MSFLVVKLTYTLMSLSYWAFKYFNCKQSKRFSFMNSPQVKNSTRPNVYDMTDIWDEYPLRLDQTLGVACPNAQCWPALSIQ